MEIIYAGAGDIAVVEHDKHSITSSVVCSSAGCTMQVTNTRRSRRGRQKLQRPRSVTPRGEHLPRNIRSVEHGEHTPFTNANMDTSVEHSEHAGFVNTWYAFPATAQIG